MKTKHILAVLCLFCTTVCAAQNTFLTRMFDRYAEMDNITSVYISKAMFQMVMPLIEQNGLNVKGIENKIESLQILTSGTANEEMRNDFSRTAKRKPYVELMHIRDEGTRTIFYANMKDDKIKELIMLIDSSDSFTVIRIVGNFTLKEVQSMTQGMGGVI